MRHDDPRPHWVYELWAKNGLCLYVGMTGNLVRRLKEHKRMGWRWMHVVSVRVTRCDGRQAASELEAMKIRALQPGAGTG